MPAQGKIVYEMKGAIGYLSFANPDKHNALDQEAWLEVPHALSRLLELNAKTIIVSGQGDSFCSGADISEFDTVRKDAETARIYEQANADAFAAIRHAPVPTIAKIQGYCLGGGFGLAAACDIRIATDNAKFSVPAAILGLAYPVDAMADIVHGVGAQNAKRLLFTAKRHSAEKMKDMGFLDEIVDTQQLDTHIKALAHEISSLAPLPHRATKAAIDAALGGKTTREKAVKIGDTTFDSSDYAEGRIAFKQKRKPKFTGQ